MILTPELEERIAAKVRNGDYPSPTEVVRACLDLLDSRDCVVQAAPEAAVRHDARPIWEIIAEIGQQVPDEEWAKVPSDMASNLDHYLYGFPRSDSPAE